MPRGGCSRASRGVARVAEQVGYSSRSHFTQQFEARYGVSPARYGKSGRS